MTFWAAALRAAVSVAVGLLFALGIARRNSVICLCWFAPTLLMFSVELCLSVWRFRLKPGRCPLGRPRERVAGHGPFVVAYISRMASRSHVG